MRLSWLALVTGLSVLAVACAKDPLRAYEEQGAPSILFDKRPFHFDCAGRWPGKPWPPLPPGAHGYLTFSPQMPYSYTRLETLELQRQQIPALTFATENGNILRISIQGARQDDWNLQFCAQGDGNSEAEARRYLSTVSMNRTGSLVTMNGGERGSLSPNGVSGGQGQLIVDAPADAPVTVHSSSGAIAVHDMDGPVRLAAPQARITVLNTTGEVDATGGIVDFAGSKGTVMTSSMETDIKITAQRFEGRLSAYAVREARVLVPRGFQTPMELIVNRPKDLICRADFCKNLHSKKNGGIYTFFKFAGDGDKATDRITVRSESSTVVIDNAGSGMTFPPQN
jgi:hypothetical protein